MKVIKQPFDTRLLQVHPRYTQGTPKVLYTSPLQTPLLHARSLTSDFCEYIGSPPPTPSYQPYVAVPVKTAIGEGQ
ncbi:hypothetical protein E2C01_073973 [Portunus trituberculatus]|uniref:Uncharacterized protein n=1 Tax=Portunus trituberculatus TaxID=210409 RepID=A0A5B7IB59_PORTR|nr:hypothetical protein [Portunus trituberculatus]